MQQHDMMWRNLFETHYQRVYRRVCMYTGGDTLAEDAVQVAFQRLFEEKKPPWKGEMAPWLIMVAMNAFRDMKRKVRREKLLESNEDLEHHLPQQSSVETEVLSNLQRHYITQLVMKLPNRYRRVLLLYYYDRLTYAEIAGVLKLPMGTVRSRLSRARSKFRILLGEEEFEKLRPSDGP